MRRIASAGLVAVIAAALMLTGATPAMASAGSPPPGAVKDIPGIPSNTIRMTQTAAGGNWRAFTAADWFNYTGWKLSQPGTDLAVIPQTGKTVAVVPKPITAPTAFVRGAAGGPLLGSFMGGFAIGTAGVQMYGIMTNTDPLAGACGSGWETAITVVYMGMGPDCAAIPPVPNPDVTAGTTITLPSGMFRIVPAKSPYTAAAWCGPSVRLPTGQQYRFVYAGTTPGQLVTSQSSWTTSGAYALAHCAPLPRYSDSAVYHQGPQGAYAAQLLRIERLTTATGVVTESATPVTSTGNPVRTPSCSISWRDGTTTKGTGSTYTETAGVPITAAGLGCKSAWDAKPGAGREVMPDRIGVESTDDAGAKTQIADQPVPEFSETQKIDLDPTLGNGRGLVLEKVIDGAPVSCMTWAADCTGWWEATSQGTSEGPYRCTYGGAPLSIGECGPYRKTFDTKTNSPTITDPSTGLEAPWQSVPQTGNSISPGTGPGTGADPAGECFAQGWAAFNPIEWVLTPIKCAFVWAFVPRAQVAADARTNIETSWRQSTPGQLANRIASISPALAGLAQSGCGGLILPTPKIGPNWSVTTENRALLAACPGDFFAPWAPGFYWFITVALVFGGFFAIKRTLDRFVGLS